MDAMLPFGNQREHMALKNSIIIACEGVKYNHRPQANHDHIQKRCSHIVTNTLQ